MLESKDVPNGMMATRNSQNCVFRESASSVRWLWRFDNVDVKAIPQLGPTTRSCEVTLIFYAINFLLVVMQVSYCIAWIPFWTVISRRKINLVYLHSLAFSIRESWEIYVTQIRHLHSVLSRQCSCVSYVWKSLTKTYHHWVYTSWIRIEVRLVIWFNSDWTANSLDTI